jgi:ABC-2 type transport system ATP-binding protein
MSIEPSSAGEALIHVSGFSKTYSETVAVDGLDFSVLPGTILGLVGPNGAGKTTTLRALSGIIPATSGRLLVAGFDIATEPIPAKQALAYIPDDANLFEALTVWEHLQFIASAYRVEPFEEEANRLLERFDMLENRDKLAADLSRGMRQKVSICCALLHQPAVLLFDEPLTGLDPRGIRTLKDTIRHCAEQGLAVVISSHMLHLVEDLCTELLILHQGRRLFLGPLEEARQHFSGAGDDASLEDVFFHATEGGEAPTAPEE